MLANLVTDSSPTIRSSQADQGSEVAAVAKSVLPIRFPQAEPEQAAVVAKSIPHSSASNLTETAYCWIAGSQCRQQQD